MEEKKIEDEIDLKGQVLKNKAETKLEKWYPLNTKFRIVKPEKSKYFQIEIEFPSDVRTGIGYSIVKLHGDEKHKWASWFRQEEDYELKNLQTELVNLRRRNSRLQSMIEVFWNINKFKDKNLLVKKVRIETINQLLYYFESQKDYIEEEYGNDDYLDVIDGFKKELELKLKDLQQDFIKESNHWKLWESSDYEVSVADLEF